MTTTTTAICPRQQIVTQFTGGIAIAFLAIAAIFLAPTVFAAPPLPGAIFTTNADCTGVNKNIYAAKSDVYLNGGPAHPNAASLPDGNYYVQVTDPSGACVLGTSVGGANQTPFVVSGGAASCIPLCAVLTNGPSACALNGLGDINCGYNDTPNAGGEYKVWVSNDPTFTNSSTKTDNFKVVANTPPPPPDNGKLCVDKFYDANANGIKDANENFIDNWLVFVSGGTLQDSFLTEICLTLNNGSYTVSEAHSLIGNWIQTASFLDGAPSTPLTDPVSVTINGDNHQVVFGNVCLAGGGGLTLGFWSNQNGQTIMTGSKSGNGLKTDVQNLLRSLNLRNANGTYLYTGTTTAPTTQTISYTQFRTWILGASATNMAYMLSAQLAAMELNVYSGNVKNPGTTLVRTPGTCGNTGFDGTFISISDLMANAIAQLGPNGYTLSGNPNRATQECLKTTLDNANNNQNFVQSAPCPFGF